MGLCLLLIIRGWATVPMIGFDPDAVSQLANLEPNFIPVMLMPIGHKKEEPRPRDYRRPVEEVVKMNILDGQGLKG